jgi:hypothetical protein
MVCCCCTSDLLQSSDEDLIARTLHIAFADATDPYNESYASQRNVQFVWSYLQQTMSAADLIRYWCKAPKLVCMDDSHTIVHNWYENCVVIVFCLL